MKVKVENTFCIETGKKYTFVLVWNMLWMLLIPWILFDVDDVEVVVTFFSVLVLTQKSQRQKSALNTRPNQDTRATLCHVNVVLKAWHSTLLCWLPLSGTSWWVFCQNAGVWVLCLSTNCVFLCVLSTAFFE